MAATRSGTEPSMEEILASIRRIIAEDGPNADIRGQKPEPAQEQAKAAENSPVLDLTEMLEDSTQQPPSAPAAKVEAPLQPPSAPAAESSSGALNRQPTREKREPTTPVDQMAGALLRKPSTPPPAQAVAVTDPMVSARAQAQAQQALSELRRAAEQERVKTIESKRDTLGLESLVLEALKPSLKAWLDQNLGPLVERIVREEVQRLVKQQTQA